MIDMWNNLPRKPQQKHFQVKDFGLPKKEQYKILQDVSKAHVDSFNYMLNEGLSEVVSHLQPLQMEFPNGKCLKIEIKDCTICKPMIHKDSCHAKTFSVYPSECRSRKVTYKGNMKITFTWSINNVIHDTVERVIGEIPIMVKSDICNIKDLKPAELTKHGEEMEEFGGYFIINGNERVVRLLVVQRRNFPVVMVRNGWKNRGQFFTEYGVSIRCVRSDQSSCNMTLHYTSEGKAKLMLVYGRELFYIPVFLILKALCDVTDHSIYNEATKGKEDDTFYKGCIVNMLRELQADGLYLHSQIKDYLGDKFRVKFNLPSFYTNAEITDHLLKECVCVHLDSNVDKFNLLVHMVKKLFTAVKGGCSLENPDNLMNQEVMLPGHFMMMVIKEKLESWLISVRFCADRKMKLLGKTFELNAGFVNFCITRSMNMTRAFEYVLATGNFVSKTSNVPQASGLTVVADKLNFWRYISHFRCIHRGSFFAEMRTTTVRKLLPEAWGFVCPLHTPDGGQCGLLNHMSAMCQIVNEQPPTVELHCILSCMGLLPCSAPLPTAASECYTVMLNGKILGVVLKDMATEFVNNLRFLKMSDTSPVPDMMEICFVALGDNQYPGIYLFTTPARLMRPVYNIDAGCVEFIGTMEQVYLNIETTDAKTFSFQKNLAVSHKELTETCAFSILASMIPYLNQNQSPRNMYECQMGKQTMGTPLHALKYRSDNTLYRIMTPQSPIVRPAIYDFYHMDEYPLGTNAIVAVISYTGYDMEDAMVINKSSLERGLCHGSVYKTHYVDLKGMGRERRSQVAFVFGRKNEDNVSQFLDSDGLPHIGAKVKKGDPMCSYINLTTGKAQYDRYKYSSPATVMDVKVLGNDSGTDVLQKICITLCQKRNPEIGDKFASRHGQKGVCSIQMPATDMPFTESGMIPDILFNPHGFPSRMTIGMLIESMAGKLSAIQGVAHDATPFRFTEKYPAYKYFGEMLKKAGYNYYGNEKMYSGISGQELQVDIFFGIVYYQRLRHMVSDKFQMRTTGAIEQLTRQPISGRQRGGGIRFGEMERDTLIGHGASFLVQDRLFQCSDRTLTYICVQCGSILSPMFVKPPPGIIPTSEEIKWEWYCQWLCKICGSKRDIECFGMPYVFRYLCAELASCNISVQLKVEDFEFPA